MRRAALVLIVTAGCTPQLEETFVVVGTLERERIELVAEAQEPIVKRAVREGQHVGAGALLLQLDDTRLRAQVAQAAGARDRAAARLAESLRGPRAERIAEARAQLAGAQSGLHRAALQLRRAGKLQEQGVISDTLLEERQAAYDEARSRRDAARATLRALRQGTTAEALAQAHAALAEAEAALAAIRVRAERLTVRAPRPGWVDALPYHVGERPPPGAVVAVLLRDSAPYARVFVPEPVRVRVVPGVAARVHVDGIPQAFEGRVRSVSKEAAFTPYYALTERDRSRLTYLARVDLLEARARTLPSGLPAQVTFAPSPAPAEAQENAGP